LLSQMTTACDICQRKDFSNINIYLSILFAGLLLIM